MTTAIDLGDESTWTPKLAQVVDEVATEVASWPEVNDETIAGELTNHDYDYSSLVEQRVREAIDPSRVLAYHASCLLPHEVDRIRHEGLRLLSLPLIDAKLTSAREHYPDLIDDDTVALLRQSAKSSFNRGHRAGLISAVTPLLAFDESPGEFHHYLEDWGGEAISATGRATDNDKRCAAMVDRLSARSTPTIIEFSMLADDLSVYCHLWTCAVGLRLGLDDSTIMLTTEVAIPAEHVVSFVEPADERWPVGQRVRR